MSLWSSLRRFGNRDGNVAILFGFGVIPLVLGAGLAVDYGRALVVRERMASALDAAALAVGSWPGLGKKQIEEKAKQYFDANFAGGGDVGEIGELDVKIEGETISLAVTSRMPTAFMQIAGFETMDVRVETEVTKEQLDLELALVLDTTGSMGWDGKLEALQRAAKELTKTLFNGEQTSTTVKIAMVPFSAAVNVGPDKRDSGWIDVDARSPVASEDFKPGVNTLDLYDDIRNRDWNGCVRERAAPYDLADVAPDAGRPETQWAPYFAPDEPGDLVTGVKRNEFPYENNYADDSGFGGRSKDVDGRQRYTGKYANLRVSGDPKLGPQYNCPVQPIQPLTNRRGQIDEAIGDMVAVGNTVIPEGLVWGWRVLSPGAPYTEGKPYSDRKTVKAVVLLTDGANMVNGGARSSGHNGTAYNAFGYASAGHLGRKDGRDAERALDAKVATLCESVKGEGIQIYTIGFKFDNARTEALLRDCATKPSMAYTPSSNDDLTGIFKEIATGLSGLRISR